MIRLFLSALGLSAALVCAAPASAQDRVSGDVGLNLASAASAAVFERRVDIAATEVCGRSALRDLHRIAIVAQCRREVLSGSHEMAGRVGAADRGPVMAAAHQFVLAAIR